MVTEAESELTAPRKVVFTVGMIVHLVPFLSNSAHSSAVDTPAEKITQRVELKIREGLPFGSEFSPYCVVYGNVFEVSFLLLVLFLIVLVLADEIFNVRCHAGIVSY